MVSLAANNDNTHDFVSDFISSAQPQQPSVLDTLNALPYIANIGSPITKITKAPDGRRCSYWIYFENKAVAYIPDIEDLRKVDRMELILSRTFERSVNLQPAKLARAWRENEASLIMKAAVPAIMPVDTLDAIIAELLEDEYLAYQGEVTEEITGRKAAQVFADQAPIEHLDRRIVVVPITGGIFLHRPALSIMLDKRFREKPPTADIGAVLRRLDYRPTHPYPARHSASSGGAAIFSSGVRMWFKAMVGEIPA